VQYDKDLLREIFDLSRRSTEAAQILKEEFQLSIESLDAGAVHHRPGRRRSHQAQIPHRAKLSWARTYCSGLVEYRANFW
jgi:hypothetical protein